MNHGRRAVAEKLGESGHFVHLDVTDPDQWDAAIDAAVTTFGRLDALVNNTGIVKLGALRGSSLPDWQQVLDVNLTGAYLGMRAVIEPMIAAGRGSIVNISSVEDLAGSAYLHAYVPRSSVYAASPNRRRLNSRPTAFGSTRSILAWCTPR
jgi:3alpha(or 20beta)-hydroxysteroid dehydrogenase